jgi:primosomal protein N' (replication factor Y)
MELLNERELLVVEALANRKTLSISEVSDLLDQKKVIPVIKTMIEKGVILLEEELVDRFRPKTEVCVRLSEKYKDDDALRPLFDLLNKKAQKQLEILMTFINMERNCPEKSKHITRQQLLKDSETSAAQLNALIKKGVFETYEVVFSRLYETDRTDDPSSIVLNEEQENAVTDISSSFELGKVALLHGVTSSGKTECYIRLIEKTISEGKQVLFLLPEIALTTQIINRLRKYFGNRVGIYHSKYNDSERVEVWNKVLAFGRNGGEGSSYDIVLGARSAIFLPFSNLGLVIVDEEHDTSYKQYDPAPRYNARDAAVYLAWIHKAGVVLGSATPCIESYYNAKSGKYTLVELLKRYGNVMMPEVLVADIKEETKKKLMKSIFSNFLLEQMEQALTNKEQIILFQNRRGFSLRLECKECSWVPQCVHCDVTLIHHKQSGNLRCHYCGYTARVPDKCPACGNTAIMMKGFGTEKVEEELAVFLPKARIKRMDLDTTRTRNAYQRLINDFEDRKTDILVGTQMVTKGLDFDNVSLVGILNADNMLTYPDFRSFERAYQMMAQVSGRAGRKDKQGKVIIQSYNPWHSVIRFVIDNDYTSMYDTQILERRNFKYPPFYRLLRITLKHKDSDLLNRGARIFAESLRRRFNEGVLGPEYPPVSRIKNYYLKNILLKFRKDVSVSQQKNQLYEEIKIMGSSPDFKSIRIILDVDPL